MIDMERSNDELFMLYLEVSDLFLNDKILKNINKSSVIIEVKFLDYPPFILQQEQSLSCLKPKLIKFKPHQAFNLQSPVCLEQLKLQLRAYKLETNSNQRKRIFYVEMTFNERQRSTFKNMVNECCDTSSFIINNRYKLTDQHGGFTGLMTLFLRFIRCQGCERASDLESCSSKRSRCSQLSLKMQTDSFPQLMTYFHEANSCDFNSYIKSLIVDKQLIAPEFPNYNFTSSGAKTKIKDDLNEKLELMNICADILTSKEKLQKPNIITCNDVFDQKSAACRKMGSKEEIFIQQPDSPLILDLKNVRSLKTADDSPSPSKDLKKFKDKKSLKNAKKKKRKLLNKKSKPAPVVDPAELRRKHQLMVRRCIKKFVYHMGNYYPGLGKAHANCVDNQTRVPKGMGWRWNVGESRSGWRPGALPGAFTSALKTTSRLLISAKNKIAGPEEEEDLEDEEIEVPPTLRVQRRDGKYHVSMYPVEKETESRLELPPKPIQFTIEKDKDDTSSTASDMEIEYSVPIAVSRYRKKPDVVHVDTQVRQAEILSAMKPPKKKDKNQEASKNEEEKTKEEIIKEDNLKNKKQVVRGETIKKKKVTYKGITVTKVK